MRLLSFSLSFFFYLLPNKVSVHSSCPFQSVAAALLCSFPEQLGLCCFLIDRPTSNLALWTLVVCFGSNSKEPLSAGHFLFYFFFYKKRFPATEGRSGVCLSDADSVVVQAAPTNQDLIKTREPGTKTRPRLFIKDN